MAVLFAPLIGVTLLPKTMKRHDEAEPGRMMSAFTAVLTWAMRMRWVTIGVTLLLLGVSIYRPGLRAAAVLPELRPARTARRHDAAENSTIAETRTRMDRLEQSLRGDDDIVRWSSYVGQGAIRFYLPLDQQLANSFYGQIVIVTKSLQARDRLQASLERLARDQFVGIDVYVHFLELGPPVGRPVQYRVSGPDIDGVREQALKFAEVVASNPHVDNPTFNWNEPGKVLKVDIQQDKARQLGVSSQSISSLLAGVISGTTITQVRDSIYLINVVARGQEGARNSLETLQSLQVPTNGGKVVPLLSFAKVGYDLEQPIIWRRDRAPTITVQTNILDDVQSATVVQQLAPAVEAFRKQLPDGYGVAVGGAVEESAKSQAPIVAVVPLMLVIMAFVLMVRFAERAQASTRGQRRAAGPDRRRRRPATLRAAARLRRDPRRPGPDRHHRPQFGDPDWPDRREHRSGS